MTDLVEAARGWLNELKELDLQLSPAQELIAAMADEIERLDKHCITCEKVRNAALDDIYRAEQRGKKSVLDDLREWHRNLPAVNSFDVTLVRKIIGDYEKDKLK